RNLNLAANGRLTGAAAYNLKSEAFRFDLTGENWNLAELRELQNPKMQVSGLAGFRAQGSGTVKAPVVNASLQLRQLVLNEEAEGDLEVQENPRGPELVISPVFFFKNFELLEEETVERRDDFPPTLKVNFPRLDIDPLLKTFLKGQI